MRRWIEVRLQFCDSTPLDAWAWRAIGVREETLDKIPSQAGLSLLFASGMRPSAGDIERLLASAELAAAATSVSFRPGDDAEGMVELLVSGLTFDLWGLSPAAATPVPPERYRYGTIAEHLKLGLEAITLVPSQHIASGFAMIPIVQAMARLAAHIALPLGAEAVCWHPAETWMEPQYYSRIALNWLSGGPFPALGLTALQENPEGFRTEGLGFLVGQELQVDGSSGESQRENARLAMRLIDSVVCEGRFTADGMAEGPDGERLQVKIGDSGRLATVRRLA